MRREILATGINPIPLQHLQVFQKNTADLWAGLNEFARKYREMLAAVSASLSPLAEMWARHRRQTELLRKQGLLPHTTTPWRLYFEGHEENFGSRVIQYYKAEWTTVEDEFRNKVATYRVDDEAKASFAEALACHRAGMYRATVRLLFPEIERVYRNAFEIKAGRPATSLNEMRSLVSSLPAGIVLDFEPTTELYIWLDKHIYDEVRSVEALERCARDPVPNRHAAIHGLLSYNTVLNSLNTLIIADFIFYLFYRLEKLSKQQRAS